MFLDENDLLLQEKKARIMLEGNMNSSIIEETQKRIIVGCGQSKGGGVCNYCENDRAD